MARRRLQDNEQPATASESLDHTEESAAPLPRNQVVNNIVTPPQPHMAGETVSVTWGEELYTPKQFCSFRVGPFSAHTTLRQGETREQAADRMMRELEKIADREREKKVAVYMAALAKMMKA